MSGYALPDMHYRICCRTECGTECEARARFPYEILVRSFGMGFRHEVSAWYCQSKISGRAF